jgi:hypothetical protein
MTNIAESGSASGSISQRHRSADPDPHQNVMDPEHCMKGWKNIGSSEILCNFEVFILYISVFCLEFVHIMRIFS